MPTINSPNWFPSTWMNWLEVVVIVTVDCVSVNWEVVEVVVEIVVVERAVVDCVAEVAVTEVVVVVSE
jgi:hypothetical protein